MLVCRSVVGRYQTRNRPGPHCSDRPGCAPFHGPLLFWHFEIVAVQHICLLRMASSASGSIAGCRTSRPLFQMPVKVFEWQEEGGPPSELIVFFGHMGLRVSPRKVSQSVSRLIVWHDVQLSPKPARWLSHLHSAASYPKMVYSDLSSLQASIYAVHSYFP